MEIQIDHAKDGGYTASIDGKQVAKAKTLAAIHKAVKAHLAGEKPEADA